VHVPLLILLLSQNQVTARPEAPPAPSRPGRHMVEIGGYLGTFIPSSSHELYDSTRHRQGDLSALGPGAGLRLGYFPFRFVGAEVEGGASGFGLEGDDAAALYAARSHLVLQIPARLTPFVVGGGGMLGVEGGDGGDADRAAHWGGGLKWYADARWSVRTDARHIISAAEGPDAGNTSHFEATLGFSFALHRAPERAPEPVPVAVATEPEPEPEAAAEPEPPSEGVVEVDPLVEIQQAIENVRFGFDSATVHPSQMPLLDEIARKLRAAPDVRVTIIGHACDIGPEPYNLKLSVRRAQAVRRYLLDRGVEPDSVGVEGRGENVPLSPDDRTVNRRTEFEVRLQRVAGG
jgi:outer membrane protein OmpA-like peptidoglycan-associated protein